MVYAPGTGIVTERLVPAGGYVMEGTPLYSIAEINPVWVQAEIYETEIHKVPVGTPAVVTTEAYPGREFKGLGAWGEGKPNTFEPRMVKVGHKSNGYYELLSGLKEGETVVTSAGFLIDSESQLKSGQSGPHPGQGAAEGPEE